MSDQYDFKRFMEIYETLEPWQQKRIIKRLKEFAEDNRIEREKALAAAKAGD